MYQLVEGAGVSSQGYQDSGGTKILKKVGVRSSCKERARKHMKIEIGTSGHHGLRSGPCYPAARVWIDEAHPTSGWSRSVLPRVLTSVPVPVPACLG